MNDEAQFRYDTDFAAGAPPRRTDAAPAEPRAAAVQRPVWKRRPALVAGLAVIAICAAVAALVATRAARRVDPPAVAALPVVSVRAPGRTAYTLKTSFTGAIVARYDMPIGVEGDGGRITAVLVEAGDRVRAGEVLARLDTSVAAPQVASLRATVEQNRAEAALAEADYRRAAAVAESVGALSKEEVDRRRALVATSAARVKAAEAQLAEAEARLGRGEIRAPAAGVVLTRSAEVGQTVVPGGAPLFRLGRGGEVEMRALVAEQDLPRLRSGQSVEVRLTGVPTAFAGHVRLLAAVIDPQTRLAEIRVALRADPNLRPGAFARGEAEVGRAQLPIVPQSALLTDDRGTYVLIAGAGDRVERRAVRFGGTQPNGIVIAAGLDGGERVVTTAGAFLREGEKVRPQVARD